MKKCSYCKNKFGEKRKRSREHVIPEGLLNLFPNQKITFTQKRAYQDNFGQAIGDTCEPCNGGYLSKLDYYGIQLIKYNFIKPFRINETIEISFDNDKLSKWLIKIAFNHERVAKGDIYWFDKNIDYIRSKGNINGHFSIFAGINADIVPFGEENGLYMLLSINSDLKFYDKGFYDDDDPIVFNKVHKSYSFRFANAKFILILWDDDIKEDELTCCEELIDKLFPYKNIYTENLILERVNDAFSYMFTNLVIGYSGLEVMDSLLNATVPNLDLAQQTYREFAKTRNTEFTKEIEKQSILEYNKNNIV